MPGPGPAIPPPPGPAPVPPFPPPPIEAAAAAAAVGRAAVPAPPPAAVPAQRAAPASQRGTVYRGGTEPEPSVDQAAGLSTDGSGSLTGFILSRGQADAAPSSRRRLIVVGIAIFVMIAALVAIGLVAVGSLFDSLLGE